MTEINYSPTNPGGWETQSFNEGSLNGIEDWVKDKYIYANRKVSEGTLLPFNAVVFSKANLKEIFNQKPTDQNQCTHVAFSHLVVKDSQGQEKSTLVAIGEDTYGGKYGNPGQKFFIGTPVDINFGIDRIESQKIKLGTEVPGYTWISNVPNQKEINTILKDLTFQRAFLYNVDMLIKVRFDAENKLDLFNETKPDEGEQDTLIAFFPAIFYCKVDRPEDEDADVSGNYCTLIGCEITKDATPKPKDTYNFLISRDAWRPNWPVGGKQRLREKIEELIRKLDELTQFFKK